LTAEKYPPSDKALKHECTDFLLHQPGVVFRTLGQRVPAPELITQGLLLVRGGK